jgi:hypothetical protein|tara:strand:- start:1168 stop:1893 length:726 start_codon:yes stop_codon:yes gene_type:complete
MAVSIDTVYQKVLAIANKEQRGYVTPQEFNLFANHAQMNIFDQYFYDQSQFLRVPGNNTSYADPVTNLEEKISIFERYDKAFTAVNEYGDINLGTILNDLYRIGMVRIDYDSEPRFSLAEKISFKEQQAYETSPLVNKSKIRPYYTSFKQRIKVYPYPIPPKDRVLVSYVVKPKKVVWGYNIIGEHALYDATISQEFQLHPSEENNLIVKILALAGISLSDPGLYQIASAEDQKNIQQEKQ